MWHVFKDNEYHKNYLKKCLDNGADPNARDKHGNTSLHFMYGNVEAFEMLVAGGACINVVNNYNSTPLHTYVYDASVNLVRRALELEARVDVKDYQGNTPLCAVENNTDIMLLLLNHGASVKDRDREEKTILHKVARFYWGGQVVTRALELGADVNAIDKAGRRPINYVQDEEIARLFLDHGADPRGTGENEWTLLHWATWIWQDADLVKRALAGGVNVNSQDNLDRTPLHLVKSPIIAQVLLDAGAHIDALTLFKETVLHTAENIEIAEFFLSKKKVDINAKDCSGRTALHRYIISDNVHSNDESKAMIVLLLKYGVDPRITDAKGNTAIDISENEETKQLLRDAIAKFEEAPVA